jgi:hypothetical protein
MHTSFTYTQTNVVRDHARELSLMGKKKYKAFKYLQKRKTTGRLDQ